MTAAKSRRSSRRRRPLRWSASAVREAAQPGAELFEALTRRSLRFVHRGDPHPKRPRGRGSQLAPPLQLAIMFNGAILGQSVREIASIYGVSRTTVERVLASSTYQSFRREVIRRTLRALMASQRWD